MNSDRLFTAPVVTMILMAFVMGTNEFIVIGILSDISTSLDVSLALVGSLVTIFSVAYIIGTPVLTSLFGSTDKFRVMIGLGIILILGNLMPYIADSFPLLIASRIVTAAVSGTMLSVGMAMTMEFTTEQHRSKSIAWIYAGFSIASVIGLPMGTAICGLMGWKSAFLMIAILTAALIVLMFITLPKKSPAATRVKGDVSGLISDVRVIAALLAVVFSVSGIYVFFTYIEPTLTDVMGIPAEYVSICLLIYGVACVISNIAAGLVAERGGMKLMPYIFAVQAVLFALLPISLSMKITGIAVMFGLGITMYLMNATNQLFFVNIAVKEHPSAVNFASTLNPVFFNVGTALGAFVGSLVVEFNGVQNLGYYSAVFSVLALLMVLALLHIQHKRNAAPDAS